MNSGKSAHGLHLGDVSSYTSGEPDPLYWLLMKLIVLMNGLYYIYLIGVLGQAEGLSRTVFVVQRFRLGQTPVIVCYICCILNVLMLKLSWFVFYWTDSQSTPCFECTWLMPLQTRNTFKNIQSNFTLISLITFEVLNQTSPNLYWCCRNTDQWCMQNYMENGWELTSELKSKWINLKIFNQISH